MAHAGHHANFAHQQKQARTRSFHKQHLSIYPTSVWPEKQPQTQRAQKPSLKLLPLAICIILSEPFYYYRAVKQPSVSILSNSALFLLHCAMCLADCREGDGLNGLDDRSPLSTATLVAPRSLLFASLAFFPSPSPTPFRIVLFRRWPTCFSFVNAFPLHRFMRATLLMLLCWSPSSSNLSSSGYFRIIASCVSPSSPSALLSALCWPRPSSVDRSAKSKATQSVLADVQSTDQLI